MQRIYIYKFMFSSFILKGCHELRRRTRAGRKKGFCDGSKDENIAMAEKSQNNEAFIVCPKLEIGIQLDC